MKLINKQIEENGTKLANEAVMEAKSDKEMMLRIREENAKNLIFDFAEQLISENEEYLGKDISEDATVKVRRKKKGLTCRVMCWSRLLWSVRLLIDCGTFQT